MPRAERGPASANVQRARQLLVGGAMGGHAAALLAIASLAAFRGPGTLWSSILTAVGVLAFFGLGQTVQILVADAAPQVVLAAALGSYAFRVGLPAVALLLVASDPGRLAGMDRIAVASTAIATVLGWLAAEIWTFARLRIPVFDSPPDEPR